MRKLVLITVAVLHLLLLDAITKELTLAKLALHESYPVIDGYFNFTRVENFGCAWGMLQGQVWPLAIFGLIAIGFIACKRAEFFPRGLDGRRMKFCALAECLIYAGILGNLIDRLFRGRVIDFLDFHWGEAYHFPCFNVADVFICLSVGILLVQSLRAPKPVTARKDAR